MSERHGLVTVQQACVSRSDWRPYLNPERVRGNKERRSPAGLLNQATGFSPCSTRIRGREAVETVNLPVTGEGAQTEKAGGMHGPMPVLGN